MMQPTSGEPRWTITQMGAVADRCLAPGERGSVLAVLSDVAYLRTASQEVLWLASNGTPMHRRCLKLGTRLPKLKSGAPFRVDECGLKVFPGVTLDSAAASLWQPGRMNPIDVVSLAELPGRVRALAAILDCAQASGFGQFIPQIVHGGSQPATTMDDPVLNHAGPAVLGIFDAFRHGDEEWATLYVDALVGFGAGLTPSGDDFLGGLLFGANALRTAYPDSRFLEAAVPAEAYRARTHPISWTLLNDHAKGHAIAPLHTIVNGILTGAPVKSIRLAVLQQVRLGHSTGWDTLAGLFAGLLMADNESGTCC